MKITGRIEVSYRDGEENKTECFPLEYTTISIITNIGEFWIQKHSCHKPTGISVETNLYSQLIVKPEDKRMIVIQEEEI